MCFGEKEAHARTNVLCSCTEDVWEQTGFSPAHIALLHLLSSVFIRSINSRLAVKTSLARDSRSSALVGSISSLLFLASANNAGSERVLLNASRSIFTRSAGMPGVAMMGRPNSPEAN